MLRVTPEENSLVFITAVTKNRQRIFDDPKLAERLGTMSMMAARQKGYTVLAYAILPDHLHLLVYPTQTCERTERTFEKARSPHAGGGFFSHRNHTALLAGSRRLAVTRPPDFTVGQLMQSIKGTFARTMQQGHIWQRRYFTWYIDDPPDAERAIEYIVRNWQKSRLDQRFGLAPYLWEDVRAIASIL